MRAAGGHHSQQLGGRYMAWLRGAGQGISGVHIMYRITHVQNITLASICARIEYHFTGIICSFSL